MSSSVYCELVQRNTNVRDCPSQNRVSGLICLLGFHIREFTLTEKQEDRARLSAALGKPVPGCYGEQFMQCLLCPALLLLPARTTTFNRRSPGTSDLEVVAGSSSTVPLSGAFFYSHRAAFIGVLYRPLCSDVLPTLLRVFRQKVGLRVSRKKL